MAKNTRATGNKQAQSNFKSLCVRIHNYFALMTFFVL
jgi:hypothetical protein